MEGLTVDVRQPQHEIRVEVRLDAIYIYVEVIQGSGGLPVGTGGKTLLMLSGGIDSPVAGMEVMKRGVTIEAIHFHSPPFTSEKAKEKVIELTRIMSERVGPIKLHIVPFTDLQKQINKSVHPRYTMTSTRRLMMRVADQLVHKIGADKEDIVKKAKEIGTFEVSIQPYEDCCTIFTPKNPVTEPDFNKVMEYESVFNFDSMVDDAVENIETIVVDKNYKSEKDKSTDALMEDLF